MNTGVSNVRIRVLSLQLQRPRGWLSWEWSEWDLKAPNSPVEDRYLGLFRIYAALSHHGLATRSICIQCRPTSSHFSSRVLANHLGVVLGVA